MSTAHSYAAPTDDAAAASRESSSPQEIEGQDVPKSLPEDRGRQPSIRERVKSYWPSLRSITGSGRRPKSPQIPPRPKLEPARKRAASMPRLSDPKPAGPASSTTPSAPINPITIVPAVQIPAPVAVEPTTDQSAPEIASDAETLALPGLPGAAGDEHIPSPVEEEVEHTTNDPYVSAVEGATLGELASTETAPQESPTEHARAASISASKGFGGLVQVIPIPTVSEASSATTGPVIKSSETAPKEAKEAVSSEPTNPAAQPIEAETSKPPSGEAEASKPPSGEAETSKSTTTGSTSGNPETAAKAQAKSVSMRKPKAKEPPKETPEQKEEREKAERTAEELIQQEAEEKRKQAAKDAKSKKAAAENTEKAREAAAQQRKAKEQTAEVEQTAAQKRRIKAAAPDNDPEDEPPPGGDDQPWEIYHYRPHIQVQATLEYQEEVRGVRQYDLESAYNLDVRGTRVPFQHGQVTTVPESCRLEIEEFGRSELNRLSV